VLVNNAGVNLGTRQVTADGYEGTFATNHLGAFLLTNLLLDALKAGAPSRVVTVASGAHKMAKINFDDLQFEKKYRGMGAYAQSKLANVLFGYELARRMRGTGVTSNLADPGVAATSLGSDQWLFRLIVKLPIVPKAEEGAATSIYLAAAKDVEGVSGQYFIKKKPAPSSKDSQDEAVARKLWEVSSKLVGLA
jgi:retinol dehydrogenase 14